MLFCRLVTVAPSVGLGRDERFEFRLLSPWYKRYTIERRELLLGEGSVRFVDSAKYDGTAIWCWRRKMMLPIVCFLTYVEDSQTFGESRIEGKVGYQPIFNIRRTPFLSAGGKLALSTAGGKNKVKY